MIFLVYVAACLLLAISALHVYWAFGGRWGSSAALPAKPGSERPLFVPRLPETIGVAVVLAALCAMLLVQAGEVPSVAKNGLTRWGVGVAAGVFALRVVGDFRYLGLFKRIKGTSFAYWDSRLYIPLCLYLAVACGVTVWFLE